MMKALVVLSGGQDSATCMAWAKANYEDVRAVTFTYGQRHIKEIESAKAIAKLFGVDHDIYDIPVLAGNKASALTSAGEVNEIDEKSQLPKSFVPGRNLIFLTSAASLALSIGFDTIVTGVCQTDYSGYPDCRNTTIKALQLAINLGNEGIGRIVIRTPLMFLSKAGTVKLAIDLPLGMEALALSWTCYEGGETPCGECGACVLRKKGFDEAGVSDPALK